MIFKKLRDKIQLSNKQSRSRNSSNEATTITNSERIQSRLSSEPNLLNKRNSHNSLLDENSKALGNRSASGIALCSTNNSKLTNLDKKKNLNNSIYNDLENELMMTCTESIMSSHDNDFVRSIDDLNLHHDHNTKQLFRHMNHFSSILQQLNYMRNHEQMCDVTLILDDDMIMCHKYVLGANSPYFLAMFTNGLMETNKRNVEIKQIDSISLRLLVDFMYTGEIIITEQNVQNLLMASNLLQVNSVKEACSQFIQSQLDLSNCLGILEFAEGHFCPVLHKYAEAFIEQNFGDIVLKEEFYNLNKEQLIKLISKDHISVSSEMVIFKSVIRWMKFDQALRKPNLSDILKHVRFPLMEFEELNSLLNISLFTEDDRIRKIIVEAIDLKLFRPASDDNTCRLDLAFIRPRVSLGYPRKMVIFGGQSPKANSKVESYDFRLQKWQTMKEMPIKRSRAGCIVHEDQIYLIGGFNGQSRLRSVDIYNSVNDEWSSGISMLCRRGTLGVCYLNKKIYAVGGYDGMTGLMTAECYDPNMKSWKMIANMSVRRSCLGVAVLNGYVFAVGGYCGANRECLNSVERYDPSTDTWRSVASMNRRRSGAAVNVFDGRIYVVGGHDGPLIHNSVEAYDMQANKWTLINDMNTCRRNASFVINNGLFYILGGDDGKNNLSSVEVFNVQRNVWSFMPSYLTEARSYISSIVIDNHE